MSEMLGYQFLFLFGALLAPLILYTLLKMAIEILRAL